MSESVSVCEIRNNVHAITVPFSLKIGSQFEYKCYSQPQNLMADCIKALTICQFQLFPKSFQSRKTLTAHEQLNSDAKVIYKLCINSLIHFVFLLNPKMYVSTQEPLKRNLERPLSCNGLALTYNANPFHDNCLPKFRFRAEDNRTERFDFLSQKPTKPGVYSHVISADVQESITARALRLLCRSAYVIVFELRLWKNNLPVKRWSM